MTFKTLLRYIAVAFVLGSAAVAGAQKNVTPTLPTAGGFIPAGLVNCTAEALNVSGFVGSDGRVIIYNLPAVSGPVVAHVTCQDASTGATVTGESAPFVPSPATSVDIGFINFGANTPTPSTLTVSPSNGRITAGTTEQLQVTPVFPPGTPPPDGGTGDLTAGSTGTVYASSNPSVATVSADGRVTGVSTGTAILHATNDGSSGYATITVIAASLVEIDAAPTSLNIGVQPLFPAAPVPLKVTGTLSDMSSIDLTSGAGLVYVSSDPSVADVTADGVVLASSPCAWVPSQFTPPGAPACPFIDITDPVTDLTTSVPVIVTQFVPAPIEQFALPGNINSAGFACSVDLDGTLAYVANGNGGFRIVDVSTTPSAGSTVGTLSFQPSGTFPMDVSVRSPLAAVALGSAGVALVNIASPAAAFEINCTNTAFCSLVGNGPLSRINPGGTVQSVRLSGNTLYVGSSGGFFAYDVTNPASPTLLNSCPNLPVVAVAGDSTRHLAAVLTTGFALTTMQVPGSCTPLGSVQLAAGSEGISPIVYNVALLGTSAYASLGLNGVQRVDITNPKNPQKLGAVTTVGGAQIEAKGVAVRSTPQGVLVAVGEDHSLNTVPLYDGALSQNFPLNICSTVTGCVFPYPPGCAVGSNLPCKTPVQDDPNDVGVALGNGFGVTCGGSGQGTAESPISLLQVFATQPPPNNTPPPSVWIQSPMEGSTVAGNNNVVATALATSAAGIESVQFFIGGGVAIPTTQTSPYTASFVPPNPGALTIVAQATDKTGQVSFSAPVNLTVNAVPAHSLTGGNYFTCDVVGQNDVKCWGDNSQGQLGNLSQATMQLTPVPVLNPGSAASIDARGDHTCVRDASGTVFCWGVNDHGQLGNNKTTNSPTPVQVVGIQDAVAIGVGDYHSCAVHASGAISCWGSNSNGQLGNGAQLPDGGVLPDQLTPVAVVGISSAVAVVAGQSHTCALLASGQVQCWGYNGFGELGNSTNTDSSTPTNVSNLANAVEIASGEIHTCARRTGGTLVCWGNSGNGEVGNGGPSTSYNSPQQVSGVTTATELHSGGYHTCARLAGPGQSTGGPVVCWGYNGLGQLGDGTNTDSHAPTPVSNITNAVQLGDGLYHSCALTQDVNQPLVCWGYNVVGQLGNGTTNSSNVPVPVTFSN